MHTKVCVPFQYSGGYKHTHARMHRPTPLPSPLPPPPLPPTHTCTYEDSTLFRGMYYLIDIVDTPRTVSNFLKITKLISSFFKEVNENIILLFSLGKFISHFFQFFLNLNFPKFLGKAELLKVAISIESSIV